MLRLSAIASLLLIILFLLSLSATPEDEETRGDNIAIGLSDDLSQLSESVGKALKPKKREETYEESDTLADDKNQDGFLESNLSQAYLKAFEEAKRQGIEQYKEYNKDRLINIDLINEASNFLKRFWYTGQCKRNYAQTCPNGWEYNENGVCLAPNDYNGPCEEYKDAGMSIQEKEEFAWRCQVEWPCVDELPLKDGIDCPLEWAQISQGICIAPNSYEGICPPILDISDLDIESKAAYEVTCDLRWPREEKLVEKPDVRKIEGPVGEDGEVRST